MNISKYFSLQQLSEGVYAAISTPGTGSWANAGIIDIGGQTIIFDTFATPSAARDFRSAAEELTGRKASFVINSHEHIDHVHGNQVFSDASIISTYQTRQQIAVRQPNFIDMVKKNTHYLDQMRNEMKQETNLAKRQETETLLGEYTAITNDADRSTLTLPSITFIEKMIFHGTRRSAELITCGRCHSSSDSFLYLPEDKILFLADLMHIGCHADFRQGDIDNWINSLDKIKLLDARVVVAGHGIVGTAEELTVMQNYLLDLKKLAYDWSQKDGTTENVHELDIPGAYKDYLVPSVFYSNLRFLLEK
ncbi:MBL fold metallo-hydrolase [Neobacillus drentensis]|uniref:MBL fold metallo-hydrolase n=1 Tax=Neobacillus drentensis TaxID=220684 RepID=UPI002FFD9CD0